MFIDTQEKLNTFIDACTDVGFLTIDTEFLRERTYYPKLCLLQMATESHEVIIDPLADLDIATLAPILTDPQVVKVFHAGDQDRAILFNSLGQVVRPIFDTQLAALLLGLPQQLSLSGIVRHFCGVRLSKSESFSDWSQRPLTERQLSYALDDVHYLPEVYNKMTKALERQGRLTWLEEDLRALEREELYVQDEQECYKRIKGTSGLNGRQMAVVRELSIWRERGAQARNLPRKWIITDEYIVEISRKMPDNLDELYEVRGLKEKLSLKLCREVLELVKRGKSTPRSQWPRREKAITRTASVTAAVDMLTALLHFRAHELQIASVLLATHDDLVRLAAGQRSGLPILGGWRRQLLGDELLALLDGQLTLSLCNKKLVVSSLHSIDRS